MGNDAGHRDRQPRRKEQVEKDYFDLEILNLKCSWKAWGGPTCLEHHVNPTYLPHHLGPSPCPPRTRKEVHQVTGISALGARSKFFSFLYPS